ncbi:MAG: hypothetical protein K9K21_02890 [Desulfotignum sp.]|nr:hypothetical protein [Desulfotignum sp.]
MAQALENYSKHFEGVFSKEVLPLLKEQLSAVKLFEDKKTSLTKTHAHNEEKIARLDKDLATLRQESIQQVLSDGKSDEYALKVSKLKANIALMRDTQTEIQEHLLPEVESRLDQAYVELKEKANKLVGHISDQLRKGIFDLAKDAIKKTEGFEDALHSFSDETLRLPRRFHHLDYTNCPDFSDLEAAIEAGVHDGLDGQKKNEQEAVKQK